MKSFLKVKIRNGGIVYIDAGKILSFEEIDDTEIVVFTSPIDHFCVEINIDDFIEKLKHFGHNVG